MIPAWADQEPGGPAHIRQAAEPGHDNATEHAVVDGVVLRARGWLWDTT